MKKIFVFLICLAMVVTACACGVTTAGTNTQSDSTGSGSTDSSGNTTTVYPTEISLPTVATMVAGDTLSLSVSYLPTDTTVKNVTWESSDASVLTVDETGLMTALKSGEAVVTATAQGENETVTSSCAVTVKSVSSDTSINPADQTGDFSVSTKGDAATYTQEDNIYTITAAGEYTLKGYLAGQIVVDAGDDDEVTIVLAGTTIVYDQNSPIYIKNADSVTIKAKSDTENTIYDNRSTKTVDVDTQGEGAISAKCDLKLAATGTLYVEGNYNNGIHTTKDLKIQKLTLKVKAANNGLKGKDSVTIESGTVVVISTGGDGIKTENTDVSSKGNQRGTIAINGGDIEIYAAGDGVQAADNFEMNDGSLTVRNGS